MEDARCYRAATGMPFAGADKVHRVVVGRLRYLDGNWEELRRREAPSRAARCRSTLDRGCGFPPAAGTGEACMTSGGKRHSQQHICSLWADDNDASGRGTGYDAGLTVRGERGWCPRRRRAMIGRPYLYRQSFYIEKGECCGTGASVFSTVMRCDSLNQSHADAKQHPGD